MIRDHVHSGHGKEVLELLQNLPVDGAKPVEDALIPALRQAARSLLRFKSSSSRIKAIIQCQNQQEDTIVNMELWTAFVSKSAHYSLQVEAVDFFGQQEAEKVKNKDVTCWSILKACAQLEALVQGMCIHGHIVEHERDMDVYMQNTLMDMYVKCCAIDDACTMFEQMEQRNLMSWTVLILGLAHWGFMEEIIALHFRMETEGIRYNDDILGSLLSACASVTNLSLGRHMHNEMIVNGNDPNKFVGNTLIDMYAKCGSMEDAQYVFENMSDQCVITWTSLIAGYTQNAYAQKAIELLKKMEQNGVKPNAVTFLSVMNACALLGDVELAKQIHACFNCSNLEPDINLINTIIDMYAKCDSIQEAREVFAKVHERNVVTWTTLIAACSKRGYHEEALELCDKMQNDGVLPNNVTVTITLGACAALGDLEKGMQQHDYVTKKGLKPDSFLGSSLVNMYLKCASLEEANSVFMVMTQRTLESWSGIIGSYAQQGNVQDALSLFEDFKHQLGEIDEVILISVLSAIANSGHLMHGQLIHAQITNSSFERDVRVVTAMVDMYGKCGNIHDAQRLFDQVTFDNVGLWTALIAGYAQHGHSKEVFQLIAQMQNVGLKPNNVTYTGFLLACSHMGLVEEAKHVFHYMVHGEEIVPMLEHYVCMVDLFGRSGHVQEAEGFIEFMPTKPTAVIWLALLSACRYHANVELATSSLYNVLQLKPQDVSCFVLLSNIHVASFSWDEDCMNLMSHMESYILEQNGEAIPHNGPL